MANTQAEKKAAAKARLKQQQRKQEGGTVLARLQAQNGQLQGALLNIRQMYDQKVLEADELRKLGTRKDQLITSAAVDAGELRVTKATIEDVIGGGYVGFEVTEEDDSFVVTPIKAEVLPQEEPEAVD